MRTILKSSCLMGLFLFRRSCDEMMYMFCISLRGVINRLSLEKLWVINYTLITLSDFNKTYKLLIFPDKEAVKMFLRLGPLPRVTIPSRDK